MTRVLITGASGFVGKHLTNLLINKGMKVWATSRNVVSQTHENAFWIKMDLASSDDIIDCLKIAKPDIIFHLSALSSVAQSWSNIPGTFETNVMSSINFFEKIRNISSHSIIINIGSSEEYGRLDFQDDKGIDEDAIPNPINPYGISKLTVGQLVKQYNSIYDLKIIHARPFNHIGPGQSEVFVASDFAKQIALIENGVIEPYIYVGNLEAERDFTDVRDIVEAYFLLATKGHYGQTYNVCSGKGFRVREILDKLILKSSVDINVIIDDEKIRPIEIQRYVGNNSKIVNETGWTPSISIDITLEDILNYWRDKLKE